MTRNRLEIFLHLLFWVFILFTININWSADWFDVSLRPNSPAPLSLLIFAFYFYLNAFVLIPRYFSLETWSAYLLAALLLFVAPELIRIAIYGLVGLPNELFSRDSFLFGTPSPFFFAINLSFLYRFAKDWFVNKRRIKQLQDSASPKKSTQPYEGINLLDQEEATKLERALIRQFEEAEIFLNPNLTLRELAEAIESTEKKVSYLINHNLKTIFMSWSINIE